MDRAKRTAIGSAGCSVDAAAIRLGRFRQNGSVMTGEINGKPLRSTDRDRPSSVPDVKLKTRLANIDALRGLVMVLMLLGHLRETWFVNYVVADPIDAATVIPAIGFARFPAIIDPRRRSSAWRRPVHLQSEMPLKLGVAGWSKM